jgi:hypothetical protein
MVYNELTAMWHSGYEYKLRVFILPIKNDAMQCQRHNTATRSKLLAK